ncbi:hypothetical protein D3C77_599820 [compost metagenome]
MPVRQQACGADRVITFAGEKVYGAGIFGIPLQFRGHGLLGDEDRFANALQIGVVSLPIGKAYMDIIHAQTPGFPV